MDGRFRPRREKVTQTRAGNRTKPKSYNFKTMDRKKKKKSRDQHILDDHHQS